MRSQHSLNIIIFQDKPYIRVIPGKKLFQSTLIHSVVNRGDVFAVCLETGVLTILPGVAQVEKSKASVVIADKCEQLPLL
jgi:hypothetical protein